MNVTQLVLIIRDTNYARGAEILMANMYVSIFGVLFATVWASGNAWGRNKGPSDQSALRTTFSESPGYIGSGTDPRLAGSRTKVAGSQGLPSHYRSFKDQSGSLASEQDGVHVEQVVLKELKADDYPSR
jgi:hypothetical protein